MRRGLWIEDRASATDASHGTDRSHPSARTPASGRRRLERRRGGAAGFSLARANAVRDALVKRNKIDAARIETRGLAGSRRLAVDTEGDDKHRNRRVEVHTLEF